MGQIVFNNQTPKYCNLQAIREGGQHVNDVLILKEVWLVDTTDSNKGEYGTGKYDAYIVGDGTKTAGQLPLNYIDTPIDLSQYSTTSQMQSAIEQAINNANIPRNLSQLIEDNDHQTVSQSEKDAWSSGSGGGNPVDNEDLTLTQDTVPVIKFKDRAYSPTNYSSLGRKYLRKNLQTVAEKSYTMLAQHGNANLNYEYSTGGVINISSVNVGSSVTLTPSGAIDPVYAYCIIDVSAGESFLLQASTSNNNYVRAWGFIDSNNILLSKSSVRNAIIIFGSEIITAPENASKLIVNVHRSLDINYCVAKITEGETKELNVLTQEMFDSPNTAYIIQYDYTLNFGNITLPEGSILVFDGGSIINGAIKGDHSKFVEVYSRQIFNLDTYLCGTWDTEEFYPEYFGAVGNGTMDCYPHIQKCLDTIHYISTHALKTCMLPRTYKISHGLLVYQNTKIKGSSSGTWTDVSLTLKAEFENKMQWIIDSASISWKNWETYPIGEVCPYNKFVSANATDNYCFQDNHNIVIENISISGTVTTDRNNIKHYIYGGIRIQRSNHSHISDVYVTGVWIGIAHAAQWYSSDRDLWVSARNIAMYFATDCNHFTLYNGYLNSPSNFSDVTTSEYSSVAGQLDKPTNIVCHYSSGNIINPITQGRGYAYSISGGGSGVSSDNTGSSLYISHPYIEGAYDTFFTMTEYTKCIVLNGVYVAAPSRYFLKTNGNGAKLRLIGFNDVNKIVNSVNGTTIMQCDNLHTTSPNMGIYGNFGTNGNLIYSVRNNKYYMIGSTGVTGIDGYDYQTIFSGTTLPSENNLKVGTPFMLKQADRTKPVFESVRSEPAYIGISIITMPSSSGNVTFTILGTSRTVYISYYSGITQNDIGAKLYRELSQYYLCWNNPADGTRALCIYIPYTTYNAAESKTFTFSDTGSTGMDCKVLVVTQPVQAQYVDYIGNPAGFEYKFSDLPTTKVKEGTIGYWTAIKQPVYYKNGGWYDFTTNTQQTLIYEFNDQTKEKTANVDKTGGTLTYTINSVLNGNTVSIIPSSAFIALVSSSVTDNQNGTFTLTLTVNPNVYTSDITVPVYVYQNGTGGVLTITLTVAAGDTVSNISFDNESVKSVFLASDTNNDGELSYDETLSVTAFTGVFSNFVGTSTEHIIIDYRIFPNLNNVTRNAAYSYSNYLDIIFPESLEILGNNYHLNIFKYMGGSNNNIVCLSINPPRIYSVLFTSISKIYVPDVSVDLYKDYIETDGSKYPSSKIAAISSITDNVLRAKLGMETIGE